MTRHILTGAPGAGKTVLLRRLERAGYAVVEEAATDMHVLAFGQGISTPHEAPTFIDDILALQLSRQARAEAWADEAVIFDRSPICTLALCEYASLPVPARLAAEVERILRESVYERRVFFVEHLGFITNTEVRRISFEDTLRFADVHREVYARLGYELVSIPAGDVETRFEAVRRELATT